jgi:hypothetical protein
VTELVVHDPIRDAACLLTAGGRPRLGQHQLIGNSLLGVLVMPLAHHVGQKRNPCAQDVGQPCCLQRDLVGLRDHPRISDDGDIGQAVGGLGGVDDRQHGRGLGLVALERLDSQRKPGSISQQPEGDLRLETPLLENPGSRNPSPASVSKYKEWLCQGTVGPINADIAKGRHIEEHQAGGTQPSVSSTRC